MTLKTFPTEGIFAVRGGISRDNFLSAEHARRFRYVRPAHGVRVTSYVADCWIVDKLGGINPGTNLSPVPFRREHIGRRIA